MSTITIFNTEEDCTKLMAEFTKAVIWHEKLLPNMLSVDTTQSEILRISKEAGVDNVSFAPVRQYRHP